MASRDLARVEEQESFVEDLYRDEMRSGFLVTSHRKRLWNVQIGLVNAEFLSPSGITFVVSARIFDEPVYADIIQEINGTLKIQGFSYEKKTPYEWANVAFMPSNLITSDGSHMFEHLRQFLPTTAEVIDKLEIDTQKDLQMA